MKVTDYRALPVIAGALLDEFVAAMALAAPEAASHLPEELGTLEWLVGQINVLVGELAYVADPQGNPFQG